MKDRKASQLLESFLDGRSAPCPDCGYDLRDLEFGDERPICPECGGQIRIEVRLLKDHWNLRERKRRRGGSLVVKIVIAVFVAFILLTILANVALMLTGR